MTNNIFEKGKVCAHGVSLSEQICHFCLIEGNYITKDELKYLGFYEKDGNGLSESEKSSNSFDLASEVMKRVEFWTTIYKTSNKEYFKKYKRHFYTGYTTKYLKRIYFFGLVFPDLLDNPERRILSFSHYKTIANSKLPLNEKHKIREIAEEKKLKIYQIKRFITKSNKQGLIERGGERR